jgi:hypothetical protein
MTTIQTDASGYFELKDLAPGIYDIQAQHDGYNARTDRFSGDLGPIAFSSTRVIADQTSNVVLSMTRGSTISGRILDANGNSVTNITVAAFQKSYQDGRAVLTSSLSKLTDDRGEYRIFWLSPGEYYVGVLPGAGVGARGARGVPPAGTSVSHPTFYPGVIDAKLAGRIEVEEGAETSGISINLQAGARGVTVAGRVDNAVSKIPTGASQFYLVSLDHTAVTLFNTAAIQNTAVGAHGGGNTDFQINGVLPGSYDLIAVAGDEIGRPLQGRKRIDVGNQDLNGITILVHPGVEVKGHLSIRGNGTSAMPLDSIRVQLRTADGTPAVGDSGTRGRISVTSRLDPSMFSYTNVPDGRYSVQVLRLPEDAYIEDIREESRSIYDSGLTIGGGRVPGEIEIVINSDGERVQGTVLDSDQKPVAAHVVLAPSPSRRYNANLNRTATSNGLGKFTMTGVAPGDYKLFAWEDVPNGAWENEEFMTSYEALGTPVTVTAGNHIDLQLRVIPAKN